MRSVTWNIFRNLSVMLMALIHSMPAMAADPDWLPPRVAEGVMQQLQARMAQTDPSRVTDPTKAKQASRDLVTRFRQQIDRWGPDGVISRAPPLAAIKLPSARQRELDAMARYQICNLVLMLQYEDGADKRQKQIGAMGLTAMTMTIFSLRPAYLKAGGREERIKQFLTSAEMERVHDAIQRDPKQLDNAQTDCGKVMGELLAAF